MNPVECDIRCELSLAEVDVRTLLRDVVITGSEEDRDIYVAHYYQGDVIHGDKVGGDKIGGHKAGGDLIDVGDIQDAGDIAIGRNKNMHSEGDEAK